MEVKKEGQPGLTLFTIKKTGRKERKKTRTERKKETGMNK